MASIKVNVTGYDAELDIPGEDDVLGYRQRELMLQACADYKQKMGHTVTSEGSKELAIKALEQAIKEHFSALPVVQLTEE